MNHRSSLRAALLFGAAILWLTAQSAWSADASATRPIERALAADGADGQTLTIDNLVGEVDVRPADGNPKIVATVYAGAADKARAEALAKRIDVTLKPGADGPRVHVDYPLSDYTTYVYHVPSSGKSDGQNDDSSLMNGVAAFFRVFWGGGGSSHVVYDDADVHVTGKPSSGAADVHVDLRIELPRGMSIAVDNRVGPVTARSIAGKARLRVAQGPISVRDMGGAVDIQAGSGHVNVQGDRGDVTIATGSGDVAAEDIAGTVDTKQGSGDFDGRNLRGGLTGKAGSGDFKLDGLQGSLKLRLGSGDVDVSHISRIESVDVRSGSGDISLAGDLAGLTGLSIASGSGDVRLQTPAVPPLRLSAETQSGDIDVQWPGAGDVSSSKGEYQAVFGTGQGKGRIVTGSGDISLLGS